MVVVPALVEQDIHKAWVLMREAIVVLAPNMARKEHVEAGDRLSPGDVAHGCLEPLGMLVHHRVDDVDKGLVGRPQAMASRQEIALEQAFALVLGKLLDNIADRSHVLIVCRVVVEVAVEPLLIGHLVARLQAVRCRLVGAEDAEAVTVIVDELGRVLAEDARRLGRAGTMSQPVHVEGIILRLRQLERLPDAAAIGIGVRADSELAFRHELGDFGADGALLREEARRLIGLEPPLEHLEVRLGIAGRCQRHLMRTPGAFGLLAVDRLRAGPALRGAEDNHRVGRTGSLACSSPGLDVADLVEDRLEQGCKAPVDRGMILLVETGNEAVGMIAHAPEELLALAVRDAGKDCRVRDLVAIEMQDRQDDAICQRIHELVGLPARGQRSGLRLAVADDRHGKHARIVEHSAIGVGEHIAKLAAFVD